ncbi:hypothetical protein ARMGADRAFT_1037013 [Armillaria gallica]|uniref:Uncharacterized protein n=1 Tax=Armillaria gallica TaxID=47427 RepID=A0A2H3CNC0_ARMGA|nr:hypothetical protein ARMGADRAFT_1037013 [Armillaria gallica]
MSQYFVTDVNGNIPCAYTICHNPHLQAFHIPDIINPPSLLSYQERVDASLASQPLSLMDLATIDAKLKEMKLPIVFDIKHSWRIFGSSLDSAEGLWMFDLSDKKQLELARCHNVGMTFKTGWIMDIKIDIEDTITCINFIMAHTSIVPGTPLPHYVNTELLASPLQSTEQAHNLHALAFIAMGELLTFINHWRVTMGSLAYQSIKNGCPTYLLNLRSADDSNDDTGEILAAKDMPTLIHFLNNFQDANSTLQPVKQFIHGMMPMYIPPHSLVFLDIDGWRLIPLTQCLWLVMRWIYEAVMLPYLSPNGCHIVKFKYQHLLQFIEGSQAGKEAQNK